MTITINRASVRLSKSMVSQMKCATMEVLKSGSVLGHVVGCLKDSHNTMLIEYNGDVYAEPMGWLPGEKSMWRRTHGHYTVSRTFSSEEIYAEFWKAFCAARDKALKTHIYV